MSLLHLLFMFVGKASLEVEKSWLKAEAERWGLPFNLEGKNVGYKSKMFFVDLKKEKKNPLIVYARSPLIKAVAAK